MAKGKKSKKGKTVLKHPDKQLIDDLFYTGWSAQRISSWLKNMDKEPVSEITLRHYRNNFLDKKKILSQSAYEKYIKGINVQVDSLQELYNLIEIQKRRIGITLVEELKLKTTTPETREEMKILKDTLVQCIKLEMDLGVRDKRAIEIKETRLDITDLIKDFLLMEQAMKDAIEP